MPNQETVLIVFRNAKKLQDLANAILDAARIESNTIQIYKENVNLKDIIQDALKEIEGSHNDKLEVVYEPKDLFIVADKDRITQVISNLLSNALKFTREGKISVNVIEENISKRVIVSIKDTGYGIDREMRSRLFTKFATKSYDGTGLGLYISRSVIEVYMEVRNGLITMMGQGEQHFRLVYQNHNCKRNSSYVRNPRLMYLYHKVLFLQQFSF